ncbi:MULTISPECIES: hypothetical protein [unclassified Romboutsia]|uniref:hypothetical protein n=1 Tax=unclassified Romboutsia TaxID=2626894 RepID=UPI000F53B5F5|nr:MULTISPECIES: hypothetical protein [unclassified Romboutsia]
MIVLKNINKIKITYNNGFTRIIEKDSIRNFSSLIEWMDKFNKNEDAGFLTLSGRDLGSAVSINKNNVKYIESI